MVETPIALNLDYSFCDNVGLYPVYSDSNFEYHLVALSQNKDWDILVLVTMRLALFNLFASNAIQLISFEDEKSYFGGIYKSKYENFSFKVLNSNPKGYDKLSVLILRTINEVNNDNALKAELKVYVRCINDYFLGKNDTYNKPEKKFIIQLIRYYAKDYSWINIEKEKRLFGLYSDYKVVLDKMYIPRLKQDITALEYYYNTALVEDSSLKLFVSKFREVLRQDFSRRLPANDDSDFD